MQDEFNLSAKVLKEDFKRYFSECPKFAWIFYNLNNFKRGIELKKSMKYEYHLEVELEDAGEFDTSNGFDPFSLYENLLKGDNLSEEEKKQREALLQQFESIEGFDMNNVDAETILDGKMVGTEARAFFRSKMREENNLEKTNFESFSFEEMPFYDALKKTQAVMNESHKYKYLFEPTFQITNGLMRVKCDVLINHGNNVVEIIEVKASSAPKKEHFFDLLYQWFVLTNLGYKVIDVKLCLLNSNYYRGIGWIESEERQFNQDFEIIDYQTQIFEPFLRGNFKVPESEIPDDIEIKSLFIVTSIYGKKNNGAYFIKMFENIDRKYNLKSLILKIALELNNEKTLEIRTCPKYSFDYKNNNLKISEKYCKNIVPWYDKTKFNLFQLPRFKDKAAEIMNEHDIIYMDEINDKLRDETFVNKKNKPYFTDTHRRLIEITLNYQKTNEKNYFEIIDQKQIKKTLKLLSQYYQFPVYMYDFETAKWAIPNFNGTNSYQQIPFQYSIHVLTDKNFDFLNWENTMHHYNFIARGQKDPRAKFLENFIKDSFKHGPGVYVAYYKSFEKGVLKKLMLAFPEYYAPLKWIYQNTIDLRDFFSLKGDNWLIYDPEFNGSSSIKSTQPALDNSLSYKDLRINKGDKASITFRKYVDKYISEEVWTEIIESDMLKYCDRDTLAMVVVLQTIIKIFKKIRPNFETEIEEILKGEKICIK